MGRSYTELGIARALSCVVMFVLTMSMIRQWGHFYWNLSNAYMALIMVAPMGLIMLAVMWSMFKNTTLNIGLGLAFLALFSGALFFGRQEALVGDEQFLESMIPHHSRAISVCQEANITDPEIEELCTEIVETQREESTQVREILRRH